MKGVLRMNHAMTRRLNGAWAGILKGVFLAIAATAALVAVFALIISLAAIPDNAVRAVNQGIKLLAIVLGVCAAVARGGENGAARGALVGLAYMAVGVLVYALLAGRTLAAFSYLADLLLGIAAGGLTGMLRSRAQ